MEEYKYKAFISYRHTSPDMEAAERLQKLLEGYKPPKNFAESKGHWRIFRDVSELQSSGDLSEDIRNAIENSEFLIVICSPSYSQSKWCMQELIRFRELHGDTNDNIITLLVDGEPDKAFPELLCFTEMRFVDENGKESTVKAAVEPLAANIKADSLKDSMKKLKTEYLRIAAPLIGCDFNDLYQREKKREAQRRMRLFGSAFVVLSVITVISAVSAVTIKKKNSEIKNKNAQIAEQYTEIEKQYNELVIENAQNLAAESEILYKNGSYIPAIKKALEALPATEGEKPAVPEAQLALSKEMGMFNTENNVPQYALKHDCAIEKLSFMGDGKGIVSQDSSGIYFWNASDGSLIKKITPDDAEFAAPEWARNVLYAIIEPDIDKTGTSITRTVADFNEIESSVFDKLYDCFAHSVTDNEPGTGGDVFVLNSNGTVWRLNGANGDIIWRSDREDSYSLLNELYFDGENLLRLYTKYADTSGVSDKTMLDIINAADGSILQTVDLTDIYGSSMSYDYSVYVKAFRDGTLYFFRDYLTHESCSIVYAYTVKDGGIEKKWEYRFSDESMSMLCNASFSFFNGEPVVMVSSSNAYDLITVAARFDKETGEPVWETKLPVRSGDNCKAFLFNADELGAGDDVLVLADENHYSLIGYGNGDLIDAVAMNERVCSISFSRAGLLMFTVKSGEEYVVKLSGYFREKPLRLAYLVQKLNQPFALCSYSRGRYVIASEYSNTAYIQFTEKNASYTGVAPGNDKYCTQFLAASSDGSKVLAMYADKDLYPYEPYVCDTVSGKFVKVDTEEISSIIWADFLTNDKLIAYVNGSGLVCKFYFINTDTGELTEVSDAGEVWISYTEDSHRRNSFGVLDNSVYFIEDSSDFVLKKLSADGTVSSYEFGEYIYCNNRIYCAAGNKAAFVMYEDYYDAIWFFNFDSGKFVTADHTFNSSGEDQIVRIFSINDKTVGVLLSGKSVLAFDAETGQLVSELKLDSIGQELISAEGIGNDSFIILSRDLKLYEADLNGLTGKVIDLSGSINGLGFIVGDVNEDLAQSLKACPAVDSNCFFVVWNGSNAWYIDAEKFKVRYAVSGFAYAPSEKAVIFTYEEMYKRLGYLPIYTPQQLVDTATEYLRKLGEADTQEQ